MDTTLFTNILFAALSLFLILITIGFVFLIVCLASFLKNLNSFLNVIRKESEKIIEDVESIRGKVMGGGAMFSSLIMNVLSFFKNHQGGKHARKS